MAETIAAVAKSHKRTFTAIDLSVGVLVGSP